MTVQCEVCGEVFENTQGLSGHMRMKHGAQRDEDKDRPSLPLRIGSKDIIPPEVELAHIKLQDGDYKLGFIDGMRVLILAARYNQLLAANQAEVMKTQLEILKAAKSESEEVAVKAAAAVGDQIIDFLGQALKEKPDIAQVSRPFEGLMARVLEASLTNLVNILFPNATGGAPAGFTRRTETQRMEGGKHGVWNQSGDAGESKENR